MPFPTSDQDRSLQDLTDEQLRAAITMREDGDMLVRLDDGTELAVAPDGEVVALDYPAA